MACGLLGAKLAHSYSPQIHRLLGNTSYSLFEKAPEELEAFLTGGDFTGINVTIPYKQAVIPYCAELSDIAKAGRSEYDCQAKRTADRSQHGLFRLFHHAAS